MEKQKDIHLAVDVEPERPSAVRVYDYAARVYDYYLGGSRDFAVDRATAEQAIRILPELPANMHANRAFLRWAVPQMLHEGVRQFLDSGFGIPTVGDVHEAALSEAPDTRGVAADIGRVAAARSQSILEVIPAASANPPAVSDRATIERFVAGFEVFDLDGRLDAGSRFPTPSERTATRAGAGRVR